MSQSSSAEAPDGPAATDPAVGDIATDAGTQLQHPAQPQPQPQPQPLPLPLPATGPVVLDASFVLALLQRHPGATALAHVLPRGVMTSITAGEVFSELAGATATDPTRIEGVLRALGVRIVDLSLAAAHHFPHLRTIDTARRTEQKTHGEKAATLSLADLCVLGYALTTGAPVLTGDQHWTTLAAHGLSVPVHLYQH